MLLRQVGVDPRVEHRATLEAADQRVAHRAARIADDVPHALRVDDVSRAPVHRDVHLGALVGQAVVALLHQHHERAWVLRELDPLAHDPTLVLGIEAVVVVAVDVAERLLVGLGREPDGAHAAEIGTDVLDVTHDRRAQRRVGGERSALVGALVTGLPEALAVELHRLPSRSGRSSCRPRSSSPCTRARGTLRRAPGDRCPPGRRSPSPR